MIIAKLNTIPISIAALVPSTYVAPSVMSTENENKPKGIVQRPCMFLLVLS